MFSRAEEELAIADPHRKEGLETHSLQLLCQTFPTCKKFPKALFPSFCVIGVKQLRHLATHRVSSSTVIRRGTFVSCTLQNNSSFDWKRQVLSADVIVGA